VILGFKKGGNEEVSKDIKGVVSLDVANLEKKKQDFSWTGGGNPSRSAGEKERIKQEGEFQDHLGGKIKAFKKKKRGKKAQGVNEGSAMGGFQQQGGNGTGDLREG